MPPCPISLQPWSEVYWDAVSLTGVPSAGLRVGPQGIQRRAQRAKPPSVGGDMLAYSSRDGSQVSLAPALPYYEVKRLCRDLTRVLGGGTDRYGRSPVCLGPPYLSCCV